MHIRLLQTPIKEERFAHFLAEQSRQLMIRDPHFTNEMWRVTERQHVLLVEQLCDWLQQHYRVKSGKGKEQRLLEKKLIFEQRFNEVINDQQVILLVKILFTATWLALFKVLYREARRLEDKTLAKIFDQIVKNTYRTRQELLQRFEISQQQRTKHQ